MHPAFNSSCDSIFGCSLNEILSQIRGKKNKENLSSKTNLIETSSNYVTFRMLIFLLGNFKVQIFLLLVNYITILVPLYFYLYSFRYILSIRHVKEYLDVH